MTDTEHKTSGSNEEDRFIKQTSASSVNGKNQEKVEQIFKLK